MTDVTFDPLKQAYLQLRQHIGREWAMQHEQPRPHYRRVARAAVRARQDNQAVQIAIISLAGMALLLIEMAHYAGGALLPRMFAL